MNARNVHCKLMTFFAIAACVAVVFGLVCALISRFTGWDYMSFYIIAAIVTGASLSVVAIELMECQFGWREEEG